MNTELSNALIEMDRAINILKNASIVPDALCGMNATEQDEFCAALETLQAITQRLRGTLSC